MAVILLLIAAAWAIAYTAGRSSEGGFSAPIFSVYRYDASGAAALRELFESQKLAVKLLERGRMRESDRGVLFQMIPLSAASYVDEQQASEVAPDSLVGWVAKGNTIVQLTRLETSLIKSINFTPPVYSHGAWSTTQPVVLPSAQPRPRSVLGQPQQGPFSPSNSLMEQSEHWEVERAEVAGKLTGDVVRAKWTKEADSRAKPLVLEVRQPADWGLSALKHWRVISTDETGRALAWECRIGAGRVIVIASPTPALNGGLLGGDNAAIMLALARSGPDGRVIIDEWSHRLRRDDSVMGVILHAGLGPALLQVVFALVLYTWSTLGFRRIDPGGVGRRPSSQDQIRTLGFLYRRSLSPANCANRVYVEVLSRAAAAARCSPAVVKARLEASNADAAAKLARILGEVANAAQSQGPVCLHCGYSLLGVASASCPDCGTPIPTNTRAQIDATPVEARSAKRDDPVPRSRGLMGIYHRIVGSTPSPSQVIDDVLIRALNDSHQLAQEINRGRRSPR